MRNKPWPSLVQSATGHCLSVSEELLVLNLAQRCTTFCRNGLQTSSSRNFTRKSYDTKKNVISLFYQAISSDLIPCFFHCITSSWCYASMFANSPHFHITVPLPTTTDLRSAPAVSPFRRIRGGDDRHGVPHGSSIVRGGNVAGQGLLSLLGSYRNEHILKAKRCHRGIRGPQTNYTSKVLLERVSWILERETSIKLWWLIQGLYHTMNFIANAEFI